jgi:hypothetical protein
VETHSQYVDRWRKMYQQETGGNALDAELAYESYAGMSDCHCEECDAWQEASGYVKAALNEPYEHHNDLHWKFVDALMNLTGRSTLS